MENKSKMVWVWVVIGALVVVGLWWYFYRPAALPEVPEPLTGGDTVVDITEDFELIDLGDIESELEQLDADLEQLDADLEQL